METKGRGEPRGDCSASSFVSSKVISLILAVGLSIFEEMISFSDLLFLLKLSWYSAVFLFVRLGLDQGEI